MCVNKSEWTRIGGLATRLLCRSLLLMLFGELFAHIHTQTHTHLKKKKKKSFNLPPTIQLLKFGVRAIRAAAVSACACTCARVYAIVPVRMMLTQPSTAATGYRRQGLSDRSETPRGTLFTFACHRGNERSKQIREALGVSQRVGVHKTRVSIKLSDGCVRQNYRFLWESGAAGWQRGGERRRGGINISLFWTLVLFYSVTLLLHTRRTGPLPYQPHPSQRCPGLPTAITYKNFSGPPHVV